MSYHDKRSTASENEPYYSAVTSANDSFGGLVVSMLAAGSRVRGFEPDRSRWIFFRYEKILSMPSFGGEVK
jgi:hypothetical protein